MVCEVMLWKEGMNCKVKVLEESAIYEVSEPWKGRADDDGI